MEIVSRPDMRCPEEAVAYVKKIRTILIYLGTCDGDMEKGNLRADVNVSVCRAGEYEKFRRTGDFSHLGTRCEIKNVNSFRFIQQAIEYEARRQIEILEDGGKIDQETRLFDPRPGRDPVHALQGRGARLPLLPRPGPAAAGARAGLDRRDRGVPAGAARRQAQAGCISQYGLSPYDAGVLISEQAKADFFEAAAKGRDAKLVANWVTNELSARLAADGIWTSTRARSRPPMWPSWWS